METLHGPDRCHAKGRGWAAAAAKASATHPGTHKEAQATLSGHTVLWCKEGTHQHLSCSKMLPLIPVPVLDLPLLNCSCPKCCWELPSPRKALGTKSHIKHHRITAAHG